MSSPVADAPAKNNNRRYLGCIIAGVSVAVLGIAAVVVAIFVMLRPAQTLQRPLAVTGNETLAVVEVDVDLSDPEVAAMVDDAIDSYWQASQSSMQQLPPNLRWVQKLNKANAGSAKRQFRQFVPGQMLLALEPDAGGGDSHWVAVVNMSHTPRYTLQMYTMMFGMVGEKIEHTTSKHTYEILNDGTQSSVSGQSPGLFAVRLGNTLIASEDLSTLRRALDRMDGDTGAEAVSAQALLSEMEDHGGQATGIIRLDPEARRALQPAATPTPSPTPVTSFPVPSSTPKPGIVDDILSVSKGSPCDVAGVWAEATAADVIAGEVVVECPDEASAVQAARAFPGAVKPFDARMTRMKLQPSWKVRRDGTRVVAEVEVTDVDAAFDHMFGRTFGGPVPVSSPSLTTTPTTQP